MSADVIHLLPDHIANQIAAGEVIQSAASVVKELMENAIDAQAQHVSVHIKDAGRTLIQVIDDGKGMSDTDARKAFERHATSKIASTNDLFNLRTMGFRGEALASIAAVAQVELRTRQPDSPLGIKISIAGSVIADAEPDACSPGSIFSVKNLFYNIPARRRFLKSGETEFRNIIREFERIALVNPHIAFVLRHNDADTLLLPASGLRQRIISLFGKKLNQTLLSLQTQSTIVNIEGFVAQPASVKQRGYINYFFVNGRFMRHPYFHKAVMQPYEPLIHSGHVPDYFIFLTLDPSAIDVNIHPAKTEIKFENEHLVWQILASSVRETLGKANAAPGIDFDVRQALQIPVYNPANAAAPPPQLHVDRRYNPFNQPSAQDWQQLYKGFEADRTAIPDAPTDAPDAQLPLGHVATACFQYKLRYIVAPLKSGLVLIDQRRAHIRIRYEQYMANLTHARSASQQMLFPEVAELAPAEAALMPAIAPQLQELGFDVSPLGHNTWSINGIPADAGNASPVALLKDVVAEALEHDAAQTGRRAETLALALARKTAVDYGQSLTVEEMERIVAALFSLDTNNMITPDGKTLITVFSDDELQKRFR